MAFFKRDKQPETYEYTEVDTPSEGRPEGSVGSTGLSFRGWYASSQYALIHATVDDDPRCMRVLCGEALLAAGFAAQTARNDRQRLAASKLAEAAQAVYDEACRLPDLKIPHRHNPVA